jgi:PAS domain S-box-containing protein
MDPGRIFNPASGEGIMEEVRLFKGELRGGPPQDVAPSSRPRTLPVAGKDERYGRIRELLRDHPRGLAADGVGRALSLSRSTAARRLDALSRAGELEVETYGQTRVYILPRRANLASVLRKPAPLILVLSPGLRVTGANDPLLSAFGLERRDLVGKRIEKSPLTRHLGERVLGELQKGPGGWADLPEVECLTGDARHIFRAAATPLSGPRGQAEIVLSLEDITGVALHRRRIEELMDGGTLSLLSSNPRILHDILQTREEEERLRLIRSSVDQAGVPAMWIGSDGRLLRVNPSAVKLLGYPEEELARMTFSALGPDLPPGAWESLWAALEIRPEVNVEGRFRTKEGASIPVEIRASRIRHGDQEFGFLVAEDITRRREEEEALRRSETSLREANGRLNLLAAITRHDALNDIAALGMYLALLEPEAGTGVQEKMAALLQALRRKLEFTRDYAGLGMAAPAWEDLATVVRRGISALDTGPIRIDLDLPAVEVYRDPLFERAVANLVDNTLRHGVHATFIRFRARVEDEACTLLIDDDGVGIPAMKKEAVFRSGYGRQTGPGLFLVREILGITGMTIRETGKPGRGARFEIRIPREGVRETDGSGGASVQPPAGNTAGFPQRERAGDIA